MSHGWRNDPRLTGRLNPQFPDDLQVIVHDGGPRFTNRRPEAVWARIVNQSNDIFSAVVLNQPTQLQSVKQGDTIEFVIPASGKYPIQVRTKYLQERAGWSVTPCSKCGNSELFDAPSDLMAKVFPNLPPGAAMDSFTAFCGLCGGVQVVSAADRPAV
jgi:hypothetical protein